MTEHSQEARLAERSALSLSLQGQRPAAANLPSGGYLVTQ
jgi:hypothetical protein